MKYREDIDGLRAIAVIAVMIFHLGFLPNGYLGVDIFFVISGYLITGIIYKEISEDNFSIIRFYERRIRRIMPLLLFVTLIAFVLGLFLMLPDDLENLAQSVVASNFSANNILLLITSSNYWAALNDYKPLMHTWSLGIEEQFYFIYPALILIVSKFSYKHIKSLLLLIVSVSLILYIFYGNEASRFYLLQYRFFELSSGGLASILIYNKDSITNKSRYVFYFSLLALIILLIMPFNWTRIQVIATTILTVIILTLDNFLYRDDKLSNYFLQNKYIVFIGKISFSLYMWHQVVFAFSRYTLFEKVTLVQGIPLIILIISLSTISYYIIENPFRNKKLISTRKVLVLLAIVFTVTTSSSLYVYMKGGIIKDFPSLSLYKNDKKGFNFFSSNDNIHIHYNESARKWDNDFSNTKNKKKILVVGDSFGRDVVNVFLESTIRGHIELSYFYIGSVNTDRFIKKRINDADIVVIAASKFIDKNKVVEMGVDLKKVICFGIKNFGYNNGIHYNKIDQIRDYSKYYTNMKEGTTDIEKKLKAEWGKKYISMLEPIVNKQGKVRVFTTDGRFISQDTEHLTKNGAVFFANILDEQLRQIVKN